MQKREITARQLRAKIREANVTLDQLRQLDNMILYQMGNPPTLDDTRGAILDSMRRLLGAIQEAQRALDEQGEAL